MTVEEIRTSTKANKALYNAIMNNTKEIGHKVYAAIPVELLYADPEYQRIETRNERKIYGLAKEWDDAKMDALRVVPHPEEYRFAVVDGYGRMCASQMTETPKTSLECEIIQGAPSDPEERLKFEARLYCEQQDETERLSPIQKHKANVLLRNSTAMILELVCNEYHVSIVSGKGWRNERTLGSYGDAFNIVRVHGEECLRYIFDVIKASGFDLEPNGYCRPVMVSLRNVYTAYGKDSKKAISEFLRQSSPRDFKANAIAKYPKREANIACTLFLQDYLVSMGYGQEYTIKDGRLTRFPA